MSATLHTMTIPEDEGSPQVDVSIDEDGDVTLLVGEHVSLFSYAQACALTLSVGQLIKRFDHSLQYRPANYLTEVKQ
jgi:hypothetical protein